MRTGPHPDTIPGVIASEHATYFVRILTFFLVLVATRCFSMLQIAAYKYGAFNTMTLPSISGKKSDEKADSRCMPALLAVDTISDADE
eukprot:scaffold1481_cov401-Prasinococcus_capsulatus_cf.AAC.4